MDRKKTKVLAIMTFSLLFLGFFMGFATNFALADEDEEDGPETDEDEDGVDDEIEILNKRELKIETEDGQIEIQSKLESGGIADEFEMQIKFESEGIEIKVSYETEEDDDDDDETDSEEEEDEDDSSVESAAEEVDLEFEVEFHSLIEFVDMDGDKQYNPDADEFIQEYQLNSFKELEYSKEELKDEEGNLYYFKISTTDDVFKAHVYISDTFTTANGVTITPTQSKIDIEITNFNYLNDSSQLALYTRIESENDHEEEDDDETEDEEEGRAENEDGVKTSKGEYSGIFTWAENAEVDGETKAVIVSNLMSDDLDEDEQKLYINYARGTSIYHDPKIGIAGIIRTEAGLPLVPIILIIGAVAAVGIVAIVWRVRKVKALRA